MKEKINPKSKEILLQKPVHEFLSDPGKIYQTHSGKRLQILSPGRINVHEGPDFLEIAALIDGTIVIGDCEFHKESSDWFAHKHSDDSNYEKVILEVVFKHNSSQNANHEILVLDPDEIEITPKEVDDVTPELEDLQNYALLRLLRKCSEAQKLINQYSIEKVIVESVKEFFRRFLEKRKRPGYTPDRLYKITNSVAESNAKQIIERLQGGEDFSISDSLQELLKKKIYDEGPNLRRELILNSILPIAVCVADEKARISLFLWFWSTPALNKYGILKRKFPDLPQNFLWQQQGMLEYMKEHGKQNVVGEALKLYGFAEILSFYKLAKSPISIQNEED